MHSVCVEMWKCFSHFQFIAMPFSNMFRTFTCAFDVCCELAPAPPPPFGWFCRLSLPKFPSFPFAMRDCASPGSGSICKRHFVAASLTALKPEAAGVWAKSQGLRGTEARSTSTDKNNYISIWLMSKSVSRSTPSSLGHGQKASHCSNNC